MKKRILTVFVIAITAVQFGYSTIFPYENVMENNANLTEFKLNYPGSTVSLSKKGLVDLVSKGEFLPFAGGCSGCEPAKATYDKFKTYIGFDSKLNSCS